MTNPQVLCARAAMLLLVAALAGCAVCKSTDTQEQCRTKERDHGHSKASVEGGATTTGGAGYG